VSEGTACVISAYGASCWDRARGWSGGGTAAAEGDGSVPVPVPRAHGRALESVHAQHPLGRGGLHEVGVGDAARAGDLPAS
jgi:hypothetical protein